MLPILKKLRDLAIADRAAWLGLSDADQDTLRSGLVLDVADHMIENAIGTYALPMGVAENFVINGRELRIPMVVEEPSVVAACGFAAKLVRAGGGFSTSSTEPIMIGQIQVLDVPDMAAADANITQATPDLLNWLNVQNPSTLSKHAKAIGIEIRILDLKTEPEKLNPSNPQSLISHSQFLIVHILYYCGDAMGANLINTACEALAPKIEALTAGRVNLRILSNFNNRRMASATCDVPISTLTTPQVDGLTLAKRIVEASLFAEYDPYRATTHNKGVMNGIDAVVLATGNDWRAVEAAAHAYAARNGQYTSMTCWRLRENDSILHGEISLPMAVGIVGGATRVHPSAQVALRLMNIQTARELAEVIVCVGLAQNLAAIRALASEGIQRGHMALHARQIAIAAGASGADIDRIAEQMVAEQQVRLERAQMLLKQ